METRDIVSILDAFRSKAAIDEIIEKEFNKISEEKHLGLYVRKGKFYPSSIGQSHTMSFFR